MGVESADSREPGSAMFPKISYHIDRHAVDSHTGDWLRYPDDLIDDLSGRISAAGSSEIVRLGLGFFLQLNAFLHNPFQMALGLGESSLAFVLRTPVAWPRAWSDDNPSWQAQIQALQHHFTVNITSNLPPEAPPVNLIILPYDHNGNRNDQVGWEQTMQEQGLQSLVAVLDTQQIERWKQS